MSAQASPSVQLIKDFSSCQDPIKRIYTGDDIAAWLESEAYARVMTVLVRCNVAIKGKKADTAYYEGETTKAVVNMLDQLDEWIEDIPLHTSPQRFGNRAFRDWGQRLEEQSEAFHRAWLSPSHSALLPELLYYFNHAFGNWTRIDYGSGHELSFLGYLTILRYTGLLQANDEEAMVFRIFERYLRVCRRLQSTYRLEPAGSKGVWGLDDHQFLNFLWGSSQLIGPSEVKPSDILQPAAIARHRKSYLFLSSIEHIRALKRGPFNEHSPILYNIASTVPNWQKVNSGLMKMYQAEVLEKHPIVQHFWFGSILPWTRYGSLESLPSSGNRAEGSGGGKEEDEEKQGMAATKAPWTQPDSSARRKAAAAATSTGQAVQHPMAGTLAPWAHHNSTVATATYSEAVPWAASSSRNPEVSAHSSALAPPDRSSRERTLASTGSAAAMSTPMGAITQPFTSVSSTSKQVNK
ncbi:MAG: Serine/threonine-protein phosphatase 2A activator [Cyphobasidiales sp. Tagirdzhanova-0007]|nr:MAG: Serine/threonine-protein phosphatase 2A activator [Cyphobasidiales sp. Tagirdzhanova-0007]